MTILALPWDCLVILVALALLPPLRGTTRVRRFLARADIGASDRARMYRSTIAFQWVATAVVAWRMYADRWSLAELGIGWGQPSRTTIAAVILLILLGTIQTGGLLYLSRSYGARASGARWPGVGSEGPRGEEARRPAPRGGISYSVMRKLMPQSNAELPLFTVVLLTVSLCEEFLYRGFALAAFVRVFLQSLGPESSVAAVLAAAILFAIGHLYQGRQGALNTFLLAVLFGFARVWSGSLVPGIAAHFTIDGIAGIMGPRALNRAIARGAMQDPDASHGPEGSATSSEEKAQAK